MAGSMRDALAQPSGQPVEEHYFAAERERFGGTGVGLLIAGLAVVGLGYLAWQYIGPDLRRYLKMRSM